MPLSKRHPGRQIINPLCLAGFEGPRTSWVRVRISRAEKHKIHRATGVGVVARSVLSCWGRGICRAVSLAGASHSGPAACLFGVLWVQHARRLPPRPSVPGPRSLRFAFQGTVWAVAD
jgi:hypothetical protein